jgi:hypothetical protein
LESIIMRRIRAKDAAWISRQDEFFSRGRFATPISFFFFSFALFSRFCDAIKPPHPNQFHASASVQAPSSTQALMPYYPVAIQRRIRAPPLRYRLPPMAKSAW